MKICTSQILRNPKVPKLSFVYRKPGSIARTISPENTIKGRSYSDMYVLDQYVVEPGPLS